MSLFRNNKPNIVVFVAVINHDEYSFNSKKEMLSYLEEYSKTNVITSLSMFENRIYSISK